MPPLSVLIKPASGNCNIRCKYCFYHSITEQRQIESYGMMKEEILEVIIEKGLKFSDGQFTIAFQGGEPTLRGLDFYKKCIEFEKKYNIKNIKINNVIQTNGIVINEEWAKFFSENKFLVGISLDGPKELHDFHRVDISNSGTYKKVIGAIELFNKFNVEYNVLSVVTSAAARQPEKTYGFFKKSGFKFIQFIPCIEELESDWGISKYAITQDRYSKFLKKIFDLWYEDFKKGDYISIQYFDNLIRMIKGGQPFVCGYMGQCTCQFVIEADGGVYPCDFYVLDDWKLGNIQELGFKEIRETDRAKEFIKSSIHMDEKCKECRYFILCKGGCRRYREPFVDGKPSLNYLCDALLDFFKYSEQRLIEISKIVDI